MRNRTWVWRWVEVSLVTLMVLWAQGCAGGHSHGEAGAGESVPAELAVSGTRVASVQAKGVQIYVCKMKEGQRVWEFKAPEATFAGKDSAGKKVEGKHYKGPAWESTSDGSIVKTRTVGKHDVPGAVPWLLLEATAHEGTGVFSKVKFIQRLKTTGGVAPAIGDAKEGDEVRIEYTAEYVFWGSDATTRPG